MDLQTRKIKFIQKFLKIQSEEVISRLEKLLHKEVKISELDDNEPMTIEEFNKRIDQSMKDFDEGRFIEASQLKSKIDKWV